VFQKTVFTSLECRNELFHHRGQLEDPYWTDEIIWNPE